MKLIAKFVEEKARIKQQLANRIVKHRSMKIKNGDNFPEKFVKNKITYYLYIKLYK